MRSQWCRENIGKAVIECGLSKETEYEVTRIADMCNAHPENDMSFLSTRRETRAFLGAPK